MSKSRLKIDGLQLSDISSLQATKTKLSVDIINGVKAPRFIQEEVSPNIRPIASLQTDRLDYDTCIRWSILLPPTEWARGYGGSASDKAWGVAVSNGIGTVVAGSTNSFGAGSSDVWVLKLDALGNIVWQKAYGGSDGDIARDIITTSSGDIIVVGKTMSFGDWIADAWVLRLDADGNIVWQKAYGGSGAGDEANAVVESNGNIIVAGHTYSFGAGSSDVLVVKLDENGDIVWQRAYGGSGSDEAWGVAVADNGDIIVVGETESFGSGSYDILVLRLDSDGSVVWQKAYGTTGADFAYDVAILGNGDIIVVGQSGGKLLVLRLDSNGDIVWQKTYSIADDDLAYGVAIADNGDIIVAGRTTNYTEGDDYILILRLDSDGNVQWGKAYGAGAEIAYDVALLSNGDIAVVGETSSFSEGGSSDFVVLRTSESGDFSANKFSIIDATVTVTSASCSVTDTSCTVTDTDLVITNTNCVVTDTDCTVTKL